MVMPSASVGLSVPCVRVAIALGLLLAAATGCTRVEDPCPLGTVKQGKRCIVAAGAVPGQDEDSPTAASPTPPAEGSDPSDEAGAEAADDADVVSLKDGGDDVSAPEGGAPGSATPSPRDDAGMADASIAAVESDARAVDSLVDAGDDAQVRDGEADGRAGDASVECSDGDLAKWRSFEISALMTTSLLDCYRADPRCAESTCNPAPCLRRTAGITGCARCADEEIACVMARCANHCGVSATSDICRACACRERCVGTGASCAMGSVDICSDCDGEVCSNVSLDPALIMRVLIPAPILL